MNKKFLLTGLAALFAVQTYAQEPSPMTVEMVKVEGGEFYMGNNYMKNAALSDEAPEHKVTIRSFKMSKTEVPFDLFDLFCDATGWEKPKDASGRRGKIAVYNVSWEAAVMFCNWLSRCERLDQYYDIQRDSASFRVTCNENAKGYRLPTEAEWEYAARGGKEYKPFSFFEGAYPENEYVPTQPYRITVEKGMYQSSDPNYVTMYLRSNGADAPRSLILRAKGGVDWYLTEITYLGDIKVPVSQDPWA